MRDFFGCYLLVSKSPQGKGRTYIGFTVNPRRRIRQHNGLITAGAWKTSKWRPWEMTLVLYGFPTKIQALQFEWAWQHPQRSIIVKPIAQALGSKKLVGVRGKILLMLNMLHESPWRHFPLTLQYLAPEYSSIVKESVASAPAHMRVFTAPMEELPKALNDMDDDGSDGDEPGTQTQGGGAAQPAETSGALPGKLHDADPASGASDASSASDESGSGDEHLQEAPDVQAPRQGGLGPPGAAGPCAATAAASGAAAGARMRCNICQLVIQRHILVCSACGVNFHLDCLAARWSSVGVLDTGDGGGAQERDRFGGVPEQGRCPGCGAAHSWMTMLQTMQTIGWGNKPRGRRGRGAKKADKAVAEDAALAQQAPDAAQRPSAGGSRRRVTKPKAAADAGAGVSQQPQVPAYGDNAGRPGEGAPIDASALHCPGPVTEQGRKPRGGAAPKARRKAVASASAGAEPCPTLDTQPTLARAGGAEGRDGPGAGTGKRASKPRVPKGRKAADDTLLLAAKESALPMATVAATAYGHGLPEPHGPNGTVESNGEALAEAESPSKRRRRGRPAVRSRARQRQDEPLGGDMQPPGRPPGHAAMDEAAEAAEAGTAPEPCPREDASPVPLWRRLQARVGPAAAPAPAASAWPEPREQHWGDSGDGGGGSEGGDWSGEDLCAGPHGRDAVQGHVALRGGVGSLPAAAAAASQQQASHLGGEQGPAQSPEVVILGTTSEDTASGAERDGSGSASEDGSEDKMDPGRWRGADPFAGPDRLCTLTSWRCITSAYPAGMEAQATGVVNAIGALSASRDDGVRSPQRASPARDGLTAMDMSPPLFRANAASPRNAAFGGTAPPTRCSMDRIAGPAATGVLAFGSPVLSEGQPAPGSGPGAGSAEGGGSAGGGVTTLMAGLHCSSTSSPPREPQPDAARTHPTALANTAAAAAAPPPLPGDARSTGGEGVPSERRPVAQLGEGHRAPHGLCRSAAASAAGEGDGTARGTGASEVGRGNNSHPPLRQPLAEVVDLCSPLPLRSRLGRKVAEDGGDGGLGLAGLPQGKRLRSPKPRTVAAAEVAAAHDLPSDAHDGSGDACQLSGWSVSPWPLRRRQDNPEDVTRDGGEVQEPGDDAAGGALSRVYAAEGGRYSPGGGPGGAKSGGAGSSGDMDCGGDARGALDGQGVQAAGIKVGGVVEVAGGSFMQARALGEDDDDDVIVVD